MTKFNKGDWCFHEFELKQILEMEGDKITSVSSGQFRTGSSKLHCYPLTLEIKVISDAIDQWYKRVLDIKISGLNIPDIKNWFIQKWYELCKEQNEKKRKELYEEAMAFVRAIEDRSQDLSNEVISGIRLFR